MVLSDATIARRLAEGRIEDWAPALA